MSCLESTIGIAWDTLMLKKFCVIYQKCPLSWTSCILSSSPTGKPEGAVFRAHKSRGGVQGVWGRELGLPEGGSSAEREVRGNIKEHKPGASPAHKWDSYTDKWGHVLGPENKDYGVPSQQVFIPTVYSLEAGKNDFSINKYFIPLRIQNKTFIKCPECKIILHPMWNWW